MRAAWTKLPASGSGFRSRVRSFWRMAASCRCTTESRMGWSCALSYRFGRWPLRQRSDRVLGRDRFVLCRTIEIGDRLEAIVAGRASPEIESAARFGFNPVRHCNQFAALGARILPRQRTDSASGHGVSLPFLFENVEADRTASLSDTTLPYATLDGRRIGTNRRQSHRASRRGKSNFFSLRNLLRLRRDRR